MTRSRLDRDLSELNSNLVKLGELAEEAIESGIASLIGYDKELAEKVIAGDKEINKLSDSIEADALKILLRQQPVASDLRVISTALKMVTNLERIGDQARDICSIVLHLCDEKYPYKLTIIPQMAEAVKIMVTTCIESFVKQDIDLAKKVVKMDNKVDTLFDTVREQLIERIKKESQYANQAIYLMMVAKYFEKIGDHAENIAEWVVYCQTGVKKIKWND